MAAGNWTPELIEMAGGVNLFGEAGKHSPWMTWEELAAADPDVIVIAPCGFDLARKVNRNLATAAQALGLAMGVGSQRVAIEAPSAADSFQVRDVAPDILLFGNLGAVQLNYGYTVEHCRRAVAMIGADGLIFHLNVLQEAVQPEGKQFAASAGRLVKIWDLATGTAVKDLQGHTGEVVSASISATTE